MVEHGHSTHGNVHGTARLALIVRLMVMHGSALKTGPLHQQWLRTAVLVGCIQPGAARRLRQPPSYARCAAICKHGADSACAQPHRIPDDEKCRCIHCQPLSICSLKEMQYNPSQNDIVHDVPVMPGASARRRGGKYKRKPAVQGFQQNCEALSRVDCSIDAYNKH